MAKKLVLLILLSTFLCACGPKATPEDTSTDVPAPEQGSGHGSANTEL